DGVLKEIKFDTGSTVTSSQVLAIIEEGAAAAAAPAAPKAEAPKVEAPVSNSGAGHAAAPAPAAKADTSSLSPGGRFTAETDKIDPAKVAGTGRGSQVTKEDLVNFMRSGGAAQPAAKAPSPASAPMPVGARPEERVPMTRMRAKIAERLMQSKNSIAMLT